MTTETFARLATGRVDPDAARNAGDVTIQGDVELGARVVDNMNYLF
jgi:predicted lipid carrier protein YhbT